MQLILEQECCCEWVNVVGGEKEKKKVQLSSFIVESLKCSHSLGSVLRLRCFQDTRELLE